MRKTLTALALLALSPATAHADDSPSGVYDVRFAEGGRRLTGTATLNSIQGTATLALHVEGQAPTVLSRVPSLDGELAFAAPLGERVANSAGLAGLTIRTNAPAPETRLRRLRLRKARGFPGYTGVVEQGGVAVGTIKLREAKPGRNALLIWGETYQDIENRAFQIYANRLGRHYDAQGWDRTDVFAGRTFHVLIEQLERAAAGGFPYDRVVFIGHGGWDGPVLGSGWTEGGARPQRQVSARENPELFERFVAAMLRGTTPDAKVFVSACHAAGNDPNERDMAGGFGGYNWVHDLALRTGRTVVGPSGKTSTEYTSQHVLATLEGRGEVLQEVHVASRLGLRVIQGGETLADASPLVPIPPLVGLPTGDGVSQPMDLGVWVPPHRRF